MSEENIKRFFDLARERENVRKLKEAGAPKPWSNDPVFQTEYFCNVFREDDKTTRWFRENVRDELKDNPTEALAAITAFRWFNKIETGELIKEFLLYDWNTERAREKLKDVRPVVTGAYIIKTPDGMNKLDGVLWCIDRFIEKIHGRDFQEILAGRASMEEACAQLKTSPYLGNFMAWQVCSDARQTCLLRNARDVDTWAQAGPGSTRGIGRVFYNNPDHFSYGGKNCEKEVLSLMQDLHYRSKDTKSWEGRPLATIDVSHWLCEVDKYIRCTEGGRMKRKYG